MKTTLKLIPHKLRKITRDYYEQIYTNKLEYLKEVDKFLYTYNLPKLNQDELENLNKPVMSNKIELVINSLPTKKSSGAFKKIEEEGILSDLCYEASSDDSSKD